jgi:hypothetical protein
VGLLRDLGYTNVRHYRGGLTEWFQPGVPAAIADSLDAAEAPSDGPRRARGGRSLSTRFIDALGDQSVGALFGLWITLVIVCAVPREFAPSVRNWMDQIQRMAGEVERI